VSGIGVGAQKENCRGRRGGGGKDCHGESEALILPEKKKKEKGGDLKRGEFLSHRRERNSPSGMKKKVKKQIQHYQKDCRMVETILNADRKREEKKKTLKQKFRNPHQRVLIEG